MKYVWLSFSALCALLLCANPVRAQDAGDGTLHVLRPVIHAEQEEAELCLEFDHDLDPADHGRIASAINLELDGKGMPIRPQNISVAGNLLCLPSLEHRKEYRIVVTGVRGTKGEKLSSPYGFAFTVPDRQPSLSFTGDAEDEGMARWQDDADPVLRSVNVPRVRLELYRITDPAMAAAAWRDRQQTTLAPSESATFGHDHGQAFWSGDLVLGDTPNKTMEREVPLHDAVANAPPGLYLIVARAPETKAETVSENEVTSLATTGAAWLLRSDLRLHVLRDAGGFYGFAEKPDGSATLGNVRILAEDANGQTLAEIRTDANGVGYLPLAGDKINNATAIIGFTDKGDTAFADLSIRATEHFSAPENRASLTTDKKSYPPASPASATLTAYDAQGHITPKPGSTLALIRADGSTYMSLPVSADASGVAHLTFPAPASGGLWSLAWRQADGGVLAQAPLRVTADPNAPRIDMSVDRTIISRDGDVNLTLKSIGGDGKPTPYVAGRVFVAWSSPDSVFKEWKDYRFGNGGPAAGDATPVKSFVTNEKGAVSLHMTLTPPDDHALLHSAILSVQGDAAAGIAVPAPLTLPLKPKEGIIGIKPLAPDSRFPENGFARFAVVALDADGRRRNADDLAYQIYEEGRSFDWYQAEGRWNYKPLQQRRRIGGGTLTLGTDGDDIIEWPIAAGTYRLEITDANGTVRASEGFSAGWGLPDNAPRPSLLNLTPSAPAWRAGQEIQLHFTLNKPSMITAFAGDDHVRAVIHRFLPAGENTVTFTPGKEWNDRINLRVEAEALDLAGEITLARESDAENVTKTSASKDMPPAEILDIAATFPSILRTGDSAHASLELSNNGKMPETWRYALSDTPGLKISGGTGSGSVTIPAGQSERIPFVLSAAHSGTSAVRLDITGPSHSHVAREWNIPVMAEDIRLGVAVRQRVEPQQSTSWPPNEKANEKANEKVSEKTNGKARVSDGNILFLSPASLYGAPALLTDILEDDAFTTGEITGVMETLRLWRETILAAGLMPEVQLDRREQDALLRLLARQKADGGFSPLPESKADFASTSDALMALAHSEQPVAKPALEQAAGWLRQHLENTWFDERERPERAAAYAALAEAGRLDNASLHYFSDTSAQKTLPPLAAAQLAFAFAKIGDQPASSFWIDTSGVKKDLSSLPAAILPVLAGNIFFDPQTLSLSLEALSGKSPARDSADDTKSTTDILRAIWLAQDRKGTWRVTVNTDKRNPRDILVIFVPAKTAAPVIHNTGGDPIFLAGTERNETAGARDATRHIYQLNGTEVGGHSPLVHDETYLVVLEGRWPGGAAESILVHDDLAPALRVTGCLPPAPIEADDELAWLKNQTLTNTVACETSEDGIDMLVMRKDGGSAAPWRIAYLAKAQWIGAFDLRPASARAFTAGHGGTARAPAIQTSRDPIEIR